MPSDSYYGSSGSGSSSSKYYDSTPSFTSPMAPRPALGRTLGLARLLATTSPHLQPPPRLPETLETMVVAAQYPKLTATTPTPASKLRDLLPIVEDQHLRESEFQRTGK
ncbi:uncharacterized protein Z519_05814 [Cladophialophora bantiana CBS 173.52]|uniref:Uncharacterized protein n=1 Tax=Cladophialophora bantiana (strain ATCC 10958 / CBS 173.52 / CDC B-1940 / NIH 8579) TaxID=1442370 RepID=A0A0D2I8U2_CLAB1|nr:uncharacterized protein Z519_05814 [Cladophialophora bantiana CBS 173.52]KIW93209.1 hypothetical protein Z519_05814 [Cladophialophora bantiana CBS 173.52]